MIGNGFDLNCGMHTRYKDMYSGYVASSSSSEIITQFKSAISSDIPTWGDFELSMADYAKTLKNEAEFMECVRDFSVYMSDYLLEEVNSFYQLMNNSDIRKSVISEMRDSVHAFYKGITHNLDAIIQSRVSINKPAYRVISFNYTNVFDSLFKWSGINYGNSVNHVHGILGEDPVLGVDNENQIIVPYAFGEKGKRCFIKPEFNRQYDNARVHVARAMIENANTICVYGMSLGLSDLSWRTYLIDWLKSSDDNHLFIYNYQNALLSSRVPSEKMDYEDDARERLISEWGLEDVSGLPTRLHVPCCKNIFNIEKAIRIAKTEEKDAFAYTKDL